MIKHIYEVKHRPCIDQVEVKLNECIAKTCQTFSVMAYEIKGSRRFDELVHARVYFAKLASSKGIHQKRIAEYINRDRSVISHYIHDFEPKKEYMKLIAKVVEL